ncbi:MAG: hypothetical protein KC438_14950, partial [Thermomicrobiales bacterium]|nr:hypothetical protein [Thermomicrobiales bacterium]
MAHPTRVPTPAPVLHRLSALVMAAIALAGGFAAHAHARGRLIAYDGFDYDPPGNLNQYPGGGEGWIGDWGGLGPHWNLADPGFSHKLLQVIGNRVLDSSAKSIRTLDPTYLPGGVPLGNQSTTLWVSMLVHQSDGGAAGTWLGLKLKCDPVTSPNNPFLFFGKPYNSSTWGLDPGIYTQHKLSAQPTTDYAFLVMEVVLRPGPDDVYLWVNPDLSQTPQIATADVSAPAYGDFTGIKDVQIEVGNTSGGYIMGSIDEVRLGTTFEDVAPTGCGPFFNPYYGGAPSGDLLAQNHRCTVRQIGFTSSEPYPQITLEISFNNSVRWLLTLYNVGKKGLWVRNVTLRRPGDSASHQILKRGGVAEILVPYHNGIHLWDTEFTGDPNEIGGSLRAMTDGDLPPHDGFLAWLTCDNAPRVVGEIRDRGIAAICKGQGSGLEYGATYRSTEVSLWSVFDTGNYDYVMEYVLRDDGSFGVRLGASGYNNTGMPF